MPYLLAIPAVALPAWLVVQVIRGRVRATCCSVPPAVPNDSSDRP